LPIEIFPKILTKFDNFISDDLKKNDEKYKEEKERIKHYLKIDFITEEVFEEISKINISSNNIKSIRDFVLWDSIKKIKKWIYSKWYKILKYINKKIENKNIINRFSWTTWDNWIYSQEYNESWRELRILLKQIKKEINLEKYKILWKEINFLELIRNIFEIWYWKKKSSGKWVFEITKDWEEKENLEKNWDNILLLSNFIPSKNDPINWNYKVFTKFPKMWEEFSIEWQNFYKKPLVMIDKWATFEKKENNNWYVWKMIKNVDFQNKWIYHYAYWFTLEF